MTWFSPPQTLSVPSKFYAGKENATPIGRPIRIVDKGAKPVTEVIA
ncbi:hypothetical protein [Singulisphaera sp. GP187]|nr:hypothetical protein [Singulisphaera sp. GP187]